MSGENWGYSATNGPEKWGELFPLARGKRQSPIDISTSTTTKGSELKGQPLEMKYVPEHTRSLVNPGYCWRVDVNGKDSELKGGPLGSDKYVLEQFHCHWGSTDDKGSEHTVDGNSFAGELHLVHWNQTKYASFGEAARHPDGLAVLGVFIKCGEHHEGLDQIVKLLQFVSHKNDRVTIPSGLDPTSLLPESKAYWTYLGSLTTPPFLESVTWIVFKQPIEASCEQLRVFRQLRCYDVCDECPCDEMNGLVINNYRPPLPVGNREIREAGGH